MLVCLAGAPALADQSVEDLEVCDGLSIFWSFVQSEGPTAIFVPGQGEVDRNGDRPDFINGTPLYMLADLQAAGINTLMFDKRGVGKSRVGNGKPWDKGTIEDEAKDVQCLIRWVRENKNPRRLTLIGYNDGDIVAALAVSETDPQGIVMLPSYDLRVSDFPAALDQAGLGKTAVEQVREAVSIELGGGKADLRQSILRPVVDSILTSIRQTRAPADRVGIIAALNLPILMIGAGDELQQSQTGFWILSRANPRVQAQFDANLNKILRRTSADCNDVCQRQRKPLGSPLDQATVNLIVKFVACGNDGAGAQECLRNGAAVPSPAKP
jgi:uncharacterized protein